jgi:hypothetical protein
MHTETQSAGPHSRAVQVQARADGTLAYLVDLPPEALPPVRARDLAAAWDVARTAAIAEEWGVARLFRFRAKDGDCTELLLADADACCWAAAVDGTVGMQTRYGLAVCLRLLALVDVLARAPWTGEWLALRRDGATIEPRLLGAAATLPLTREARFDESRLRTAIAAPRLPAATAGAAA